MTLTKKGENKARQITAAIIENNVKFTVLPRVLALQSIAL